MPCPTALQTFRPLCLGCWRSNDLVTWPKVAGSFVLADQLGVRTDRGACLHNPLLMGVKGLRFSRLYPL